MDESDPQGLEKARKMTPLQRERRQKMLAAARALFLEKGFERANLDDVLAETGGSKQTLYRYFKDKLGLFKAVVDSVTQQVELPIDSFDTDNFEQRFYEIGLHHLRQVTSPMPLGVYRMILGEARTQPELARDFYRRGPMTSQRALARYLQRLNDEGKMAVEDAELSADIFWNGLRGNAHMDGLFLDETISEDALERRVRYVVAKFLAAHGVASQ